MRRVPPGGALVAACIMAALLAPGRVDAESVKTRLPGGLTVIVDESHAAPLVAASLFVRVGARWETEADAGITNLLQQMVLKGTARRSALELAVQAEDIGGGIGASSDVDFSEIRGTALGRHWRTLLVLLADVALHPSLPADELEGERRQLLRALRSRQDQPRAVAVDTLMARLYGAHPYGVAPLGRAAAIERLDGAALRAHHERYYRAGRMILSVSGDVSRVRVVEEAASLFGDAAPGETVPEPRAPVLPVSSSRVAPAHPSAQAHVLMAFLAPPVAHPDYAAMKVLATALGGGMGGRLFTELRDKQGLAYSASASYPSRVERSYLLAQVGTAPANAARAEEEMRREIERMRSAEIPAPELERAKMYLLGQFALDRRTNARLAWYAAFFESMGVGHDFPRRYVRAVEAVTAKDVWRVAKGYLGEPTIVSLGPSP
jgi:zinc protease